jgi:molybdenum cofactor guanylyltransferase
MSNQQLEPSAVSHSDNRPANDQDRRLAAESVTRADSPEPEAAAIRPSPESQTSGPGHQISGHQRATSERRRAANRVNAQKSTGPRTPPGKLRSSQNARISVRLLGLAEARTLNQDLNAAGDLYRQLIAPYEPAPPLLARQFEDLARIYLELEAWERIRDAQLEDRWQQSDIERRQRFYEMDRDLQGTGEEIFKQGLCGQPDCAAKFKRQVDCLGILKNHLLRRDFDMASILHYLYGKDMNPTSDRGQTICLGCETLMDPEKRSSVTDGQLESLLNTVEDEEQAALMAYALQLDQKSMSRVARLARLAPSRDDHWMNRHAERLRHDIDRKLKLILNLLEMYGLEERPGRRSSRASRQGNGGSESGSGAGPGAGSDPGAALPPPEPAAGHVPTRRGGPPRPPSPRRRGMDGGRGAWPCGPTRRRCITTTAVLRAHVVHKKFQKRSQEVSWNQQIDAKMGPNKANRLAVSSCGTTARRQFASAPARGTAAGEKCPPSRSRSTTKCRRASGSLGLAMRRRFTELTGFVLAGGESRRMGRPKHELMLDGETLLARTVRLARSVAATVAVLGPRDRARGLDVGVLPDEIAGRGPLGAVYTGLGHSRTPLSLFLSCDLPFMEAGFLEYLASQALESGADATVPETPGQGRQPLAAIYGRRALPAVRASLANGQNKMIAFYARIKLRVLRWPEIARSGFRQSIFDNLNTPEEYRTAVQKLEHPQYWKSW